MNIFILSAVISVSVFLIMCCCIIFTKLFGRGMLCGKSICAVTVIEKGDDVRAVLYPIVEDIGAELEYSGKKLIIADGGMDNGQRELCLRFCEKYDYFELSDPMSLTSRIFTLQKH